MLDIKGIKRLVAHSPVLSTTIKHTVSIDGTLITVSATSSTSSGSASFAIDANRHYPVTSADAARSALTGRALQGLQQSKSLCADVYGMSTEGDS
ncbi:hypothetical protein WME94_30835 [Sorangium sp. So ce429]